MPVCLWISNHDWRHFPYFGFYSVPDSDEGSEIEDIALGSESEDHWEELSDMDREEEEEQEADEVDMLSWECTSACGLQWYGEGNVVLMKKEYATITA